MYHVYSFHKGLSQLIPFRSEYFQKKISISANDSQQMCQHFKALNSIHCQFLLTAAMEIPGNYSLVVSYKTRERFKHSSDFHPNVSKPLWWWINRSVISFSRSLHLSSVIVKRFIQGKGLQISRPSLKNSYQNIHFRSFAHCFSSLQNKEHR